MKRIALYFKMIMLVGLWCGFGLQAMNNQDDDSKNSQNNAASATSTLTNNRQHKSEDSDEDDWGLPKKAKFRSTVDIAESTEKEVNELRAEVKDMRNLIAECLQKVKEMKDAVLESYYAKPSSYSIDTFAWFNYIKGTKKSEEQGDHSFLDVSTYPKAGITDVYIPAQYQSNPIVSFHTFKYILAGAVSGALAVSAAPCAEQQELVTPSVPTLMTGGFVGGIAGLIASRQPNMAHIEVPQHMVLKDHTMNMITLNYEPIKPSAE